MKNILITLTIVALSFAASGNNSQVPFKLTNKSKDSIEIVIPGFNKATLLPRAVCNLKLTKGQKIFFKYHGKQYTLLTVSGEMEGKRLDVCKIIAVRKKQIDSAYVSR